MKKLQQQINSLKKQVRDLQMYCGVLAPVFEKEYKKQKFDFSKK